MIAHRISTLVSGLAVAVVVALLTMGLASRLVPQDVHPQLIAGTDFTISSAITSQPACSGSPALLVPGTVRCLTYTVTNPLTDPITVASINLAVDPAFPQPPGCPSTNLDLSGAGYSGALLVPAGGTSSVNRTIALANTAVNQDACKNKVFHFVYSGSATYTHVYATATALVSSANPVIAGTQVTFTATVSTTGGTPPSPPTGTVTFKDGATTLTCAAGSVALTGATATCKVTFANTVGSPHSITAVFSPGVDPNFTGSTSAAVSQVVNPASVATASSLVSSVNPSVLGQSVTFTDTVSATTGTPTGTVTFFDGTTSLGTKTLAAGKATLTTTTLSVGTHPITAVYNGAPAFNPSTSNVVSQVVYTSCINGLQLLGFIVHSGQTICVNATGFVLGGVLVQSGGTLVINGGTVVGAVLMDPGASFSMNGGWVGLNVWSLRPAAFRICGASNIGGGIYVAEAASRVVIGDGTPACPGSTIRLGVLLLNNGRGLVLGGNQIWGAANVHDNHGFGTGLGSKIEIDHNSVVGRLDCAANTPAPTNNGHPNSVNGVRTGQCQAGGF